jgi:hypothetical protein
MTTQFEERLRTEMDLATAEVRLPPGLALRAQKSNRRRQVRIRAAAAVGTATVLAAGAFAVSASTGPAGSGGQYQTTSYVVSRVERALAAPSLTNVVEHYRTVFPAGFVLQPIPGGMAGLRTGNSPPVGYTVDWWYHATAKVSAYTATGQHVFDVGFIYGADVKTTTAALYGSSTWWTAQTPETAASAPPAASCVSGEHIQLQVGAGNGWPAFIKAQLACGAYTVTGRQEVNGVDAIELSGSSGLITLWVNPATYLPVRLDSSPPGQDAARTQTSFEWLAPTQANLAQLKLSVPAGFTQVQPPVFHLRQTAPAGSVIKSG